MSKECRRDDSFVTAIAHCHGDAGEANGDGENGSWCHRDTKRTIFPVPIGYVPIGLVIHHIL